MREIGVVGNVNLDVLVSPAWALPLPGVERLVDTVEVRPGGAAANTALALAALGAPPRLAACVGDDAVGRLLLEGLRKAGIGEGVTVAPGGSTGVSIAFEAPGHDRSFLTSLGSLADFDRSMIPSGVLSADLVLLCGYFLLPALQGEPSRGLLEGVHERGGTTVFDTGWDPDGWPPENREAVLELLPLVDVFLPNEVEAAQLTDVSQPLGAARALQRVAGGWVVVKLGPAGCVAIDPDGRELTVAAPAVEVFDTTGAGDAFNAGLLHALASGSDWLDALGFATRFASTVVSRPSAARYPSADELV